MLNLYNLRSPEIQDIPLANLNVCAKMIEQEESARERALCQLTECS